MPPGAIQHLIWCYTAQVTDRIAARWEWTMSVGQNIADVFRTALVAGAVALLGYLGFVLIRERMQNPRPQTVAVPAESVEILEAGLREIKEELSEVKSRLADDDTRLVRARSLQESFEISMLVAETQDDNVHVFGRLRCNAGTWRSVELAFTFRGQDHDVLRYRHHHRMPNITKSDPITGGTWKSFDFTIAKTDKNAWASWQEGSVSGKIHSAEPA